MYIFCMKKHRRWLYPLLFLGLITPFSSWIDLNISRYFYSTGNDPVDHFVSNPFLDFIFDYAPYPGELLAIIAGLALILSYLKSSWIKWRQPALVLVLTMALGAGLIVHGILKDHWGRPRPKQVVEFGGGQEFRPYYQPNFFHQPEPSKSFVCGHCSVGFYFFALYLIGIRLKKRALARWGFILALLIGIGLSVTRIAQGGHWFTDTLVTAMIMWWTALCVDQLVYEGEPLKDYSTSSS
jgi:membrane-associated PAP2 superfamily phosphatase